MLIRLGLPHGCSFYRDGGAGRFRRYDSDPSPGRLAQGKGYLGGAHHRGAKLGTRGSFIRTALNPDHEASAIGDAVLPFLFAGDRRDHLDREIIPALQRGAVVITDRYYHSSLAYQSLAVGLPAVASLNERFRAPDITIFLDLEPEISLARIEARGETRERFEALDKLRQSRRPTTRCWFIAARAVRTSSGSTQTPPWRRSMPR